jgi:biopolymer transport protein ExbD
MITNAPFFGTGLGTWFHNLVNEGYSTYVINYVQRVHNDLIELAVEIGLFVRGDKEVQYNFIVELMSFLQQHNIDKVGLITESINTNNNANN